MAREGRAGGLQRIDARSQNLEELFQHGQLVLALLRILALHCSDARLSFLQPLLEAQRRLTHLGKVRLVAYQRLQRLRHEWLCVRTLRGRARGAHLQGVLTKVKIVVSDPGHQILRTVGWVSSALRLQQARNVYAP
jgi:hypothetical protein